MSNLGLVVTAGLVGCAGSLALTPLAARTANKIGLLDRPGGYKAHPQATPLLGGLGVMGGFLCGVVAAAFYGELLNRADLLALGTGLLVITTAGLVDDARALKIHQKLAWQLAAAACAGLFLVMFGVQLTLFISGHGLLIVLLTLLWVIGITNAVNFLDNMNGLCAGLGLVAAISLAAYNLRSGAIPVAVTAAALGGACGGFLPYNWPRARVFLGDAGSMAIGFALAAISVMGVYTPGAEIPVLAVFAPIFILAIPILDVILVTALRLRTGHKPWLGDRRHISHRLVRRGMHPARAAVTLWVASAACGLAALLLPTVGLAEAPLLVALLACALGVLVAAAGSQGLD